MNKLFEKGIIYSYYGLLFSVPLAMFHKTSELFEFNKMIAVYVFTTLIVFFWLAKSVAQRKLIFRRTFLDIPILIFLTTQLLSTITSIDTRTSLFGYYTRFNGGFMSFTCYSILYWGYVSNIDRKTAIKTIYTILLSSLLVSTYAILQHLGIDAHIWVQDVKNRVFSTMGQPNWLAAVIVAIIPITWSLAISSKLKLPDIKNDRNIRSLILNNSFTWMALSIIFFLVLSYTQSRSGYVGLAVSFAFFWGLIVFHSFVNKIEVKSTIYKFFSINLIVVLIILINGTPWTPKVGKLLSQNGAETSATKQEEVKYQGPLIELGGSSSTEIRKIVWSGAVEIWKNYPILGTGVETFAYSYYNFRPLEHNLVSEWDFLYNKAHNEYLNFAATTGTLGLGSYLILLLSILYFVLKNSGLLSRKKNKNNNSKAPLFHYSIAAGLLSIYVTNFFGFSVVLVNLLLFILPAMSFALLGEDEDAEESNDNNLDPTQKSVVIISGLVTLFILISISRYWYADYLYGQGKLHNDVGNSVTAINYLGRAVKHSTKEAVIWNELSEVNLNMALVLAEKEDQRAIEFVQRAIEYSNRAVSLSDKDVTIKRKRASMYIKFSVFDPNQLLLAREELLKAVELAPSDAKLWYNLGLVYARMGQIETAQETLEKTIDMKPDYERARHAYALILIDSGDKDKAIEQAEYILEKINPKSTGATEILEENQ